MPSYSLFGLRVRSDIDLPELPPLLDDVADDVVVRLGASIGSAEQPAHADGDAAIVFDAPDVARYRISRGTEIEVYPCAGVAARNIRLYLLGSAFGALLHQRGLLPLHANAVEIDGKAVAFMGPSGAGKSTLAAWFFDREFPLIADDVCVVRTEGAVTSVMPGLPRVRLWQDALEASGRRTDDFHRSYAGADDWNKFDVGARRNDGAPLASRLALLFDLRQGAEVRFDRLSALAATDLIFAHTYRGHLVEEVGRQGEHWQAAVDLVRTVPIYAVERPWDAAAFDRHCLEILDGVRALLAEDRL